MYMSSSPLASAKSVADVHRLMQQAQHEGQTLLLDFTAKWCAPCRSMKPVVHDIAATFPNHFLVALVDVDEAEVELTDHFQVSAVPMFVFIRNHQVVHVIKGKKEEELRTTGRIIAAMASDPSGE